MFSHLSLPTSWLWQALSWALWLLPHAWHHHGAVQRSWGSQLQLSIPPHIWHFIQPMCQLQPTGQSLFSGVHKLKKSGNWLAHWGWASAGNLLLQFFLQRVRDLKGKLHKASSIKHCLAPFYTLAKCQLKWWLNLSNTIPSLCRSETAGFLLHQERQRLFRVQ